MTPEAKIQARIGIKEKDSDHPDRVRIVPRFKLYDEALMKLTSFEDPSDTLSQSVEVQSYIHCG